MVSTENKVFVSLMFFALISYLVAAMFIILYMSKNTSESESELKKEVLELREKVRACDVNANSICHSGPEYQGSIRYIDCGESFVNRWATCFCTTMCLEDFTVVITNRTRCRYWEDSVPIQLRPEPSEEEEEEDEEED